MELIIWATVISRSCFCWLYRASPSLAAKNVIDLILGCWKRGFALTSGFSWQSSVSLYPASFCIPRSYLSVTFTTRNMHNWLSFLLYPSCFILSGAISNCPPLFPSCLLGSFQLGWGSSSSSIIFSCLFILFIWFQGRNPGMSCHFFLQWAAFCQNFLLWPVHLGLPSTELQKLFCHDKAVIHDWG